MDFELDLGDILCPACGAPFLDDLRDFSQDVKEYEGPFGHVCETSFHQVPVVCPSCGGNLVAEGSIVEDSGLLEYHVTLNQR